MEPTDTRPVKPSRLKKITAWTKRHQKRLYFLAALLIPIVAAGILINILVGYSPEAPTQTGVLPKIEEKFYSPLTGLEVEDESVTKRQVTAIMIENSPDARPQSGLKEAGVVFEAIAEGGITRFIAIYQESRPSLIGPVRSVRPYYVEWGAAFDPSVAHIGGSKKALDMIRSGDYGHDIDQFFNDGAYWRATDRFAPHNVYTDFKHLDALNKSKGFTSSSFDGFARTDAPKTLPETNAKSINVDISSGAYNSSYSFDSKTNSYNRSQGGESHQDREKGQLKPKVVIVIKVKMSLGFEDGYREQITTTGSGEAYVFQNGQVVKGTWKKASASKQIEFLASDGKKIELNRGQTWITAIPNDRNVSWK